MITALLVLYVVSVLLGVASAVLAWYNAVQDGTKGLVPFVLVMSFLPVINSIWAFMFVVFLTFGKPRDF